jgi:hypothetical protein
MVNSFVGIALNSITGVSLSHLSHSDKGQGALRGLRSYLSIGCERVVANPDTVRGRRFFPSSHSAGIGCHKPACE